MSTMTETAPQSSLIVGEDQPLIGIPMEQNGRKVVRYFADDVAADAATALERNLTVVTRDADFQRVPGLKVMFLHR